MSSVLGPGIALTIVMVGSALALYFSRPGRPRRLTVKEQLQQELDGVRAEMQRLKAEDDPSFAEILQLMNRVDDVGMSVRKFERSPLTVRRRDQ
jgi:hypothetical protein